MPIRLLAFALGFVLLVACACAFTQPIADDPTLGQVGVIGKSGAGAVAQPPTYDPSVLQAPLTRTANFTVTRVDPDGTIVLGPSSAIPPQLQDRLASGLAEGLYLLLTTDSRQAGKHRLLRVQVTDIAEGSVFTLKAGARAAARVQTNDLARLIRPIPATTARLRALPDEILIEGSPGEDSAIVDARELSARTQSTNNLRQLVLAMHNFHSKYNEFPPAVINGPDGKPWHSWRVLLLPFLDANDIYNAYDFSQPWNGPKNKALFDRMPAVYRDPIYGDQKEPYTHYAALVGPTAVFRPEGTKQADPKKPPIGTGGVGMAGITDGTSNTVIISSVEPDRKIPWTKPEDIDVGPAFKGFGQPRGIAAPYTLSGPGGGKAAPFAFADGSVRTIAASIHPLTLSALISRAGGEIISSDAIPTESNAQSRGRRDPQDPHPRPKNHGGDRTHDRSVFCADESGAGPAARISQKCEMTRGISQIPRSRSRDHSWLLAASDADRRIAQRIRHVKRDFFFKFSELAVFPCSTCRRASANEARKLGSCSRVYHSRSSSSKGVIRIMG